MNFGSKSSWPFAISEGDRNLADLARQWRGMDTVCWVELMNLKVIAVRASTLPSLPQSSRSAWLSRFLSGGKQRRRGRQLKAVQPSAWLKPPLSWCKLLIRWLRQMKRFFWKGELWLCISNLSRESCQKINTFNHARALFCQSRWVRWLQLSLKTMNNFTGLPQAHSAVFQGA